MQSLDEYVNSIVDELEFIAHQWDDSIEECFRQYAEEFFHMNMPRKVAMDWFKCTEEIAPDMNEEVAVKTMEKIRNKYSKQS